MVKIEKEGENPLFMVAGRIMTRMLPTVVEKICKSFFKKEAAKAVKKGTEWLVRIPGVNKHFSEIFAAGIELAANKLTEWSKVKIETQDFEQAKSAESAFSYFKDKGCVKYSTSKSYPSSYNRSETVKISGSLSIKGEYVNIRNKPNIETGSVLFQLDNSDYCTILGRTNKKHYVNGFGTDYWYKIKYNGSVGWVFGNLTSRSTTNRY